MKRLAKMLLVTLGFGALGFVMSLVPQKNATGVAGAPVNIVGSVPVTVQGTVGALQSGTWNVNIASIAGSVPVVDPLDTSGNPLPLASSNVESPARQPFASFLCDATSTSGNTVAFCNSGSVPLGKLLVVEYVTGECRVPVASKVLEYDVVTLVGSSTLASFHALTLLGSDGTRDVYAVSDKVKQYARPGNPIQLGFDTTDTTGNTHCELGVSGYMEAAQQAGSLS